MIEISESLVAASRSRHAEDPEPARVVAKALDARLSWEPCEHWATVTADRVLAQIHVVSPLAVCLDSVRPQLVEALGPDAVVVTVRDMDDVELSASTTALAALFDDTFDDLTDLIPEGFAASDLWFSTVN